MSTPELDTLRKQFEELREQHDRLRRQRPFDRAAHDEHIVRLRAFTGALHAFRLRSATPPFDRKPPSPAGR